MNDYIFRGITQSNHKPSVAAYFEPRYNITKDLQLYAGVAGESISFPNRAAAEIDMYAGIRPTFGMFAFDFGVWGYLLSRRTVLRFARRVSAGQLRRQHRFRGRAGLPINGNFAKKSASFYEGYAKVNVTINDQFAVGVNEYYSPNFLNLGAWGNYTSITGKWTAPSTTFGSSGVGMYISGEFGRQWLGKSDIFYGIPGDPLFANGIQEPSYNTWNIGVGFTYKVFTLDFRYSDTNLSKGDCNAFTSDHTTTIRGSFVPDQPGWLRLQLVRRDRYRQALGGPDRDDQPEVSSSRLRIGGGRAICRPFSFRSAADEMGLAARGGQGDRPQ